RGRGGAGRAGHARRAGAAGRRDDRGRARRRQGAGPARDAAGRGRPAADGRARRRRQDHRRELRGGAQMSITAQDVKALRERTGAGMMDCKNALVEADGDVEKAAEALRIKGIAKAEKRGERGTSEGTVQSYIHANGKIGALVEVDCETDFVARNEDFIAFARDLALHVAAAAPLAVDEDGVPAEELERERRIAEEQF